MMVFGTIIGALIAAVITLENSNPYLRLVLLFSFAVMLYVTMRANVILTQIFLVPFIIILLNIYYPGEWYLSFIRILDVVIGNPTEQIQLQTLYRYPDDEVELLIPLARQRIIILSYILSGM